MPELPTVEVRDAELSREPWIDYCRVSHRRKAQQMLDEQPSNHMLKLPSDLAVSTSEKVLLLAALTRILPRQGIKVASPLAVLTAISLGVSLYGCRASPPQAPIVRGRIADDLSMSTDFPSSAGRRGYTAGTRRRGEAERLEDSTLILCGDRLALGSASNTSAARLDVPKEIRDGAASLIR